MLVFTYQIPRAAASGGGGSGGSVSTSNNSSSPLSIPFFIPPALFPTPSNLSLGGVVTSVATLPLPGSVAGFGVVVASTNATGSNLWFIEATYSATDAAAIATSGSCGGGCGQVPLSWTSPSNVSWFSNPVTRTGISDAGGTLVAAATSNGTTQLFNASGTFGTWARFGPSITGTFSAMAADPEEIAVVSVQGGSLQATAITTYGTTLGQLQIVPAGGSGLVLSAGVALTPDGATYLESVAFTVGGLNQIQFATSVNGVSFTASKVIGTFDVQSPNPAASSLGQTALTSVGGEPGQVGLTSVGSQLFLLVTTNVSGQTVPLTESSGTNGTTWQGPYLTTPINGSVLDPQVTVGPTGLVYATWADPDYGNGAVDQATYFSDGVQVAPPTTLVASDTSGESPGGVPAIAVDGFARPFLAWPVGSTNATSGQVAYTGAYLAPNTSLNLTSSILEDTLTAGDLRNGGGSGSLPSLVSNASLLVQLADANLTIGHLCNAQNLTAIYLYQNLTHLPLNISTSSGTVCAGTLSPKGTASPVTSASGLSSANTFYAVYLDWALEAEGVQVSTSPLSTVTQFYPYTGLALAAGLPSSATASLTLNSTAESVTVTPTPYSPTAYDLAVSGTLQGWGSTHLATCFFPTGGYAKGAVGTLTRITSTWSNLSVNNGPTYAFNGTSSFSSVWVYDLPAYQSFSWTGTYTAHTTATTYSFDDNCHPTSSARPGPVIGPMTVVGAFSTTLSEAYGARFLTATFNTNRTTAHLSPLFNNTLPASSVSTLSNASGSQNWSSSAYSIPESYSFAASSPVSTTYTYSESSTSRAGTSTSPGSPSIAYGSSGAAPAETAGLWCQFTLSAAGPLIWTNNSTGGTWPYSNITSTSFRVSWYSNQSVTGFFMFRENGADTGSTITGLSPMRVGAGNWSYSVVVHGLEPSATYTGDYGVSWTKGCLVIEDQLAGQVPNSPTVPDKKVIGVALSYLEQTYDSVSGSGGGVNLTWSTPSADPSSSTIQSGYLQVTNLSSKTWTEKVQLSSRAILHPNNVSSLNLLSLSTPLNPATKYRFFLSLNYSNTSGGPQNGTVVITYHRDTSKDGLTNQEKLNGWYVSYTTVPRTSFGRLEFSRTAYLQSDQFASTIVIDQGATVYTNGYSLIARSSFYNNGTIRAGTLSCNGWAYCPYYNLTQSFGGSGGGATEANSGSGQFPSGGTTLAGGGGSSSSGGAGGSGATPGVPNLNSQLISNWWNTSDGELVQYLGGAAGAGAPNGFGGLGGAGVYIQAWYLKAGAIYSNGTSGRASSCGGSNTAGGGGGGGTVVLAYGAGGYVAPSKTVVTGGTAVGCQGYAMGGAGGNGRVIAWKFASAPVASPSPDSFGTHQVLKHVKADPSAFSTNGLANDYLEKAYGLNPTTVDTARSDMLDLWNLTFDFGPDTSAPKIPRGFVYWNETGTGFSPWPSGRPSAVNATGIKCLSAAQCPGNDSNNSSFPLWSHSAFSQFRNLSGVKAALRSGDYFRGVLSKYGGDWILTLWGKLSWGANPLAASTPGDGIPDGDRVNPRGDVELQVNVSQWNVDSGLKQGNGVAAFVQATSYGELDYANYTKQSNCTSSSAGSANSSGSFVVTFPVDQTVQYAQLNLSLIENVGVNGHNNFQNASLIPSANADLLNMSASPTVWGIDGGFPPTLNFAFHWQAVPIYLKAPTWIYIPSDNSTLSKLPRGLQRYTGEQNFVELVVNDTASDSAPPGMSSIPYSDTSKHTYSFSLAPGLNTILVPRASFNNSPLERALLGDSTTSIAPLKYPNGTLINGTNVSGQNEPVSPTAASLTTLWQFAGNGSVLTARTQTNCSNLNHTYANSSCSGIQVQSSSQSVTTSNASLMGGVPANPALEGQDPALAVQGIFTFNENSATDLQAFLAGILLNQSENLTGWLDNVTSQLPTLGLLPSVLSGLANYSVRNDGGYGAPVSTATQSDPLPWWEAPFAWVWNAITGVFTAAISIVWNAFVAAATFVVDLAKEAARFAFNLVSQAVGVLEKVGAVILSALSAFVQWVINNVIRPAFNRAIAPIWAGATSYGQALFSDLGRAESDFTQTGNVPGSDSESFWRDFGGSIFLISLAISAAVTLVLYIVMGLTLGAGLIVGILLSLLLSGIMEGMASEVHVSPTESASATQPTAPMVWSIALVTNTTKVNGTPPADTKDSNYTPTWKTAADVVGWAWSGFSLQWAWGCLMGAFIDPSGVGTAAVGLATAIAALILAFVSASVHTLFAVVTALVVAGIGIALDVVSFKKPGGKTGVNLLMNSIMLGGDLTALGLTLVENHDYLT